ncbi:MAG TPA: acetylxylan esterase [Verrucomicrobiota bacterium]|nr:acetylxylan esterase [Verrucomicrobiota bacterium]
MKPDERTENRNPPALQHGCSRRAMLQLMGINLAGLSLLDGLLTPRAEAADGGVTASIEPLNRFPRMVHEYFVERVRQIERAHSEAHAALRTKAEAEAYVNTAREKIRAAFGPFPEKTPLNPRVTGVVERDAYRIEKVIFESRPGFLVTANLYLPKGRRSPLPAVVGACGHSDNGKASAAYQSFSQGLARMGYVVLIYDPIGQGERLQYPDAQLKSRIGAGVAEHLHAGNQQFLVGEFFGAWRAWDGIRALDYLLTRPEVDPRHLGVTGNSGGGTLTTWLCGLESRWTMAAPGCFVTTFRRNLENELPADTEQCPPRALALGLDHEDFIAAMAPKPVILLTKERDYFDIRGSEAAYARLKRLYGLLGAEDRIALFTGPTAHGYSQENREAMYRWFNRVTGVSNAQTEPELVIEPDETLWCTPKGQVAELQSRPIWSYTRERSQALARERPSHSGSALSRIVASTLKLEQRQGLPDYRILRALPPRRYPWPHATTYAVETEPGIHALVYRLFQERHESRPPRDPARAVLYVAHLSSDAELREEQCVRDLLAAEPDAAFYACDVRGIGESQPDTCGHDTFLKPYGSDYFYAIHALMLDYPYVAQRTHDVLRVLDWLLSVGHEQVHLAAKGWGTLPATFAALLCDAVRQVTLKNALASYSEIAEAERYQWPLAAFVPGVLAHFDLPDCYRALAAKQLRQIDP